MNDGKWCNTRVFRITKYQITDSKFAESIMPNPKLLAYTYTCNKCRNRNASHAI